MSEGRGKYSTTPLNGLKHSRGGSRAPYGQPSRPNRGSQRNTFVFLQVVMSALLPILFVVALILGRPQLHWIFLGLSALALLVMWAAKAFVPQARTTMSLIYTALMIVSLGAAFLSGGGGDPASPQQGGDLSALFGRDTTARDVQDFSSQQNIPTTDTPVPTEDSQSQARQQLTYFMTSWMNLDYDAMLSVCVPSWVSAQDNPQHEIFKIRGTSTPVDFNIVEASGTDADDSRTLTMNASIDKGTGKAPQLYRYEVLMLRVNGVWYVDPASLSSATEIKAVATPTVYYTLMPTETVDASIVLYYNPDGGSYYHRNAQCTRVDQRYLPLKGSFTYSQINDPQYVNLKPCDGCNAPNR